MRRADHMLYSLAPLIWLAGSGMARGASGPSASSGSAASAAAADAPESAPAADRAAAAADAPTLPAATPSAASGTLPPSLVPPTAAAADSAPSTTLAPAQSPAPGYGAAMGTEGRYTLVEDYTANTLRPGEILLGSDAQIGLTPRLMIGTDLVASVIGVPTVTAKMQVWEQGRHKVSLGLRGAYLSRNTAAWGTVKRTFSKLDARVIVPSIAWTRTLSPRLKLHTYFGKSFGKLDVVLSPSGQRQLWEARHPGASYDNRDPQTQAPAQSGGSSASSDNNQEQVSAQRSSLTQKSIQVQSLAGLAQERFEMVGEFQRVSGNKVLVASDIEQTNLGELKTNFFRLTVAHQWIWTNFQMRIGFGPQYFVVSGTDLDGEQLHEAGWTPASDISFYWRF